MNNPGISRNIILLSILLITSLSISAQEAPASARIEADSTGAVTSLEYVRSLGGDNWETIRLNITYFDRDNKSPRSSIWWKPNWSSASNYIGSGMFFRTETE